MYEVRRIICLWHWKLRGYPVDVLSKLQKPSVCVQTSRRNGNVICSQQFAIKSNIIAAQLCSKGGNEPSVKPSHKMCWWLACSTSKLKQIKRSVNQLEPYFFYCYNNLSHVVHNWNERDCLTRFRWILLGLKLLPLTEHVCSFFKFSFRAEFFDFRVSA
jgi:hypothetical protein